MKKFLDSDWLRAVQLLCNFVQKSLIPCNYNCKKYQLIGPQTLLFKINQSRATRKFRGLTCYAWCDKKLDSGHKDLTVVNLLIVNVNAGALRAV